MYWDIRRDLRMLAVRLEELGEAITILVATVGPLQGTTARIGRIVDRLPERRPRRAGAPDA
jgi:hypothetical protein